MSSNRLLSGFEHIGESYLLQAEGTRQLSLLIAGLVQGAVRGFSDRLAGLLGRPHRA